MALDLPDVYLELLCCNMACTGWEGSSIGRTGVMKETEVPFDPADYDGTIEAFFEITYHNSSLVDSYLSLVDTSGTVYATISVPPSGDNFEFFTERVEFTLPATPVTFALFCPGIGENSGDWVLTSCARIRLRQTGATKSKIQIPMLSFGTDWAVGYNYVACSIPVYNCPSYSADYSDGGSGNSLENLPIWKFLDGDLDPVSSVTFRALPGKYVVNSFVRAWIYDGLNMGTLSNWQLALYYSDDAGVTKTQIPGTYKEFSAILGDEYPFYFTMDIADPSVFEVGSRTFYIGWTMYGGGELGFLYNELTHPAGALYIPAGASVSRAIFTGYTRTSGASHDNVGVMELTVICDEADIEALSIALFDRDTDTMVEGSELSWAKGETFDWKEAEVDAAGLIAGHELEVRLTSPSTQFATAPRIAEAQIYIGVDPITKFTSWQRVMSGTMRGFWEYPPGYGSSFHPDGDGCVYALSRLKYHPVTGCVVAYQACATAYAWPSEDYPYDPNDPGAEYDYFALWDDSTNDSGVRDGEYRVNQSILQWLEADFDEDLKRVLKRTETNLAPYLIGEHRYCNLHPDDMVWMVPLDGFILMTVEQTAPPACLSVSATINAETMTATGYGIGENATQWRVVRVSDSVVMDTGSGYSPNFEFQAEYGVQYQLQFAGDDDVWSEAGCTFTFAIAPVVPVTPGVGSETQVINPWVILRWSDDGGFTWSKEHWRPLGRVGEFKRRAVWNRLGRGRDRVYWVEITDPVKVQFIDAYIDLEPGTS